MIKNYQKDGPDPSLAKNSYRLQTKFALNENDQGLWSCGLCLCLAREEPQLLSAGVYKTLPSTSGRNWTPRREALQRSSR